MTGDEHYREAERLLDKATSLRHPEELPYAAQVAAEAQIHATLALAAAQSYVPAEYGYEARERYGAVTR